MATPANPDRESGNTQGGLLPGAEAKPAFELWQRRPSPVPILIAVPHAGRVYPPSLLERMRYPQQSCLRLEDRLADLIGREVARETGAALLVAHAPRAMIDLNRAQDDMDWDMVAGGAPTGHAKLSAGRRARSGLGLVPRRLPGLGELWNSRLARNELDARIELVHRPYHSALSQMLESLRDRWGAALLLDLHSMPPLGPKNGHDPAADFVVGDRYGSSCGANLSLSAFRLFDQFGRKSAHNRPYAGGYVLDRHGAPARGLHAMQLEVCRATYLDPSMSEPGEGLADVVEVICGLVRRLAEELVTGTHVLSQAAE